jgi:hypothetical protein
MSHGNIFFGTDKNIYGVDAEGEELLKNKKAFKSSAPKVVYHEASFKLTRRGHGDPIGKYPEFKMP